MMPYEEAVEKFKDVLKLDPDNVQIWASWGLALKAQGKEEGAAEK